MSGVNIKQRLMTAGILLTSVFICASHPIGWVILNLGTYYTTNLIGFPMIVFQEYIQIMDKIMEYLFDVKEDKHKKAFEKLIKRLNNKYMSCLYMTLIHVTMMTFNTSFMCMSLGHIAILIVAVKLYVYCKFMQYPDK